jgi:hypothetical protein
LSGSPAHELADPNVLVSEVSKCVLCNTPRGVIFYENILATDFKEKNTMTHMELTGNKRAAEGKDASGKITISIWEFQIPTPENHPTFQVDVDIGPSED